MAHKRSVAQVNGAAGYVLPTREQTMLLRAALDTGGLAIEHFERWLAAVDFDGQLDQGSFNTLPLVWATLSAQGYEHPVMPRLKGVYRSAWVKAMRHAAMAEELLQVLRAEDIPTLVVKGLPLSIAFYDKPALRPMNDIDIVVPSHRARVASTLLSRRGFAAPNANWRVDPILRHALQHKHADKGEADLHWHVVFELPCRAADAHFWDAAVPLKVGAETTLQPCATDLLFHVIVHGLRWNPFPPMRWIVDAAMILRSGSAIDWSRLVTFAGQNRLGKRLSLGLALLKESYGLAIPAETLETLARQSSVVERIEIFGMRGTAERSAWRHVRRATYVVRLLQADQLRGLPGALAHELFARVRRHLALGRKTPRPAV